jgi:hypothetical protein
MNSNDEDEEPIAVDNGRYVPPIVIESRNLGERV